MAEDRMHLATYVRSPVARTVPRADVARARFDRAAQALAKADRFDPKLADLPELELLEAATALTQKK